MSIQLQQTKSSNQPICDGQGPQLHGPHQCPNAAPDMELGCSSPSMYGMLAVGTPAWSRARPHHPLEGMGNLGFEAMLLNPGRGLLDCPRDFQRALMRG